MNFLEPIQSIFERLPVFLLVLFRIAGLLTVAPAFGSVAIPVRIRALLAAALSILIFPLAPHVTFMPTSWAALTFGIASEMIIGAAMGFVFSLVLLGVQIGAELIGQQMGLSMAQLVDPFSQVRSNVLSQFYLTLAITVYVLMNGHIILIRALVDTFKTVPLMGTLDVLATRTGGPAAAPLVDHFCGLLGSAFALGIRVAGPTLIAIFLATLALGFISRTMPQLNILAAGFPIRITLAFILLIASMGVVGVVMQEHIKMGLRCVGRMFDFEPF